jgi:hypothetical protein
MKRMIPLLALTVLLLGAFDASACVWCKWDDTCLHTPPADGIYCDYSNNGGCEEIGICFGLSVAKEEPLATQWSVASVERTDGRGVINAQPIVAENRAPVDNRNSQKPISIR